MSPKVCHLRYVTVTCYKAVYYALSCVVLEFMFDNNDCQCLKMYVKKSCPM
jgi:hypothetical protein